MKSLASFIAAILFSNIAGAVSEEVKKLHSEIIWTEKDDERVRRHIEECVARGHARFLAKSKRQKEGKVHYGYRNN